jgi:tRNA pseudouridine38-40 synthase
MARYQLILAYDGTNFLGFQRQGAARTVQVTVENALRRLGWQGRAILAAGRTDTGVHASGQVLACDLEWKHSLEALRAALNASLPPDVAVSEVALAAPDFHPRFEARVRRYVYRIVCAPVRAPLHERYAWRVWPEVGLAQLQAAAAPLIGSHDFAAFGSPPRTGGSTQREVFGASWQTDAAALLFTVEANAFLYHMVRRMVAWQVAVVQDRLSAAHWRNLIEQPHMVAVPSIPLAPPQGLTLVKVYYSGENLID